MRKTEPRDVILGQHMSCHSHVQGTPLPGLYLTSLIVVNHVYVRRTRARACEERKTELTRWKFEKYVKHFIFGSFSIDFNILTILP